MIRPKFWEAEPFSEGLAAVRTENSLWGFIDTAGNYVIEPSFLVAYSFSEGMARAGGYGDGPQGFIDQSGNYVIDPVFIGAEWPSRQGDFFDNRAMIMINKLGFIDQTGRIVIQPLYDDAWHFSEGLAAVEIGGKFGFIDVSGNLVIELEYDSAHYFFEGIAVVKKGEASLFIDKEGRELFSTDYNMGSFSEGMAIIEIDGKYGYIDREFNTVIEPKCKDAYAFHEDLAAVQF